MVETLTPPLEELDDFIQAYEQVLLRHGQAEMQHFLPDRDHPLYVPVLREFIRIELETSWQHGKPRRLQDYRDAYPELFQDVISLQDITFEEYRLRLQQGETVQPGEYEARFGVITSDWPTPDTERPRTGVQVDGDEDPDSQPPTIRLPLPHSSSDDPLREAAIAYAAFRLGQKPTQSDDVDSWCDSFQGGRAYAELFRDLHVADPGAACRMAQASAGMPEVGTHFLDFELLEELGRGTFGRVYLAKQGDLYDRLVALKVSADLASETRNLAQLQHTHIVPIYSVHRAGAFQAVCMPYFGSTTLADVLKELAGFETLPQSGTHLISTLRGKSGPHSSSRKLGARDTKQPVHTITEHHAPVTIFSSSPDRPRSSTVVGMLSNMRYVDAVLWIGTRLADALDHAHERGIVHRDLKPANVLLTDQGPMLLDFNLAEDTKLRAAASAAMLGGTLPYMAPEHLEAFRGGKRPVDARSDVYSLGIILYELLTGRPPFPSHRGPMSDVLVQMLADRNSPPPHVRFWNRSVSPAVEAILQHCLEPDPSLRYQSAAELREDLQRHTEKNLPLKYAKEPSFVERGQKFTQRNRWTIGCTVAAVVVCVLAGFGYEKERQRRVLDRQREALEAERPRLLAVDTYKQFMQELQTSKVQYDLRDHNHRDRVEKALQTGSRLLEPYLVLRDGNWRNGPLYRDLPSENQQHLQREVGNLLAQMTWAEQLLQGPARDVPPPTDWVKRLLDLNARARDCFASLGKSHALLRQQAKLVAMLGNHAEAQQILDEAAEAPQGDSDDLHFQASELMTKGEFGKAVGLLKQATRLSPRSFFAWWDKAKCHWELAQYSEAAECLSICVVIQDTSAQPYVFRGLVLYANRNYADALADLSEAIHLQPDNWEAYESRAQVYLAMERPAQAEQDLTEILQRGTPSPRLYFLRSRARVLAKNVEGARQDREAGLKLEPRDELDWIQLARTRHTPGAKRADLEQALADYDQALKVNPRSRVARQNKASVLSEQLQRTEDSISVLTELLELYPDSLEARASRGVLYARLGRRDAALRDAAACLRAELTPFLRYQVAGIYALTSRQNPSDRKEALRLLAQSLHDKVVLGYVDSDADLDALRNDAEFKRLVESARTLRAD